MRALLASTSNKLVDCTYPLTYASKNLEITMYETLQRPLDVSQIPALPSVKEAAEKLKQSEQRREEKRLRQIAANKVRLAVTAAVPSGIKRKRDEDGQDDDMEGGPDSGTGGNEESSFFSGAPGDDGTAVSKKLKTEDISGEDETAMSDHVDNDAASTLDSLHPISPGSVPPAKISVSKAFSEVRGHTSYLTFGCLLPPAPGPLHAPAGSPPSVEGGQASS